MSYNQISRFEVGWRINWLGLETLDLSFNNFSGNLGSSSLNFLKHNPGEFKINLTENYIVNITIDKIFEEEKIEENYVRIELSDNPIVCSCDAHYFASGLNKVNKNAQHLTLTGLPSNICSDSQIETLDCDLVAEEWRLDIIVTLISISIISILSITLGLCMFYWKTKSYTDNSDFDKDLYFLSFHDHRTFLFSSLPFYFKFYSKIICTCAVVNSKFIFFMVPIHPNLQINIFCRGVRGDGG